MLIHTTTLLTQPLRRTKWKITIPSILPHYYLLCKPLIRFDGAVFPHNSLLFVLRRALLEPAVCQFSVHGVDIIQTQAAHYSLCI